MVIKSEEIAPYMRLTTNPSSKTFLAKPLKTHSIYFNKIKCLSLAILTDFILSDITVKRTPTMETYNGN